MSSFETGSPRVTVQVKPGNNVARIAALKSGTLYAVLLRGKYGDRYTNVIQPASAGVAMGQVPFGSLPTAVQSAITSLQGETGIAYPNGFFVAGGSANTIRNIPTWYVDKESSKDTHAVLRVAVPDFNSAVPSYLAGIRMRVSTDNGDTYGRYQDVPAPFDGGVNYATFQVSVPYEQNVLVKFQAIYKDGTFGRETRPVKFTGVAKPADPPAAAPILGAVTGTYSYSTKNNKLQLSVTVAVTPDPASSSALVQLVDATGKVRASQEVPNSTPGTALSVVLDDVNPSVATYTVTAYSNTVGKLSTATTTTWDVSSASGYVPTKLDPTKVYVSEEIYRMGDGTLESRIRVKFEGALDAERTRGAIYLRRRDNYGGDVNAFGGFTKAGIATGNFLTDSVTAGSTVQWDVVVLAVGKDGTEAAFSSDQIKTLSVTQYANYVPPMQAALPTVTVTGEDSVTLAGTYTRAAGTPEPVKIRAYKSKTSTLSTDLIAEAPYVYLGNGTYGYTLAIPSLTVFSAGSNNYDITLRTILENRGLTPTASKTTVRVVRALPSAPTLSSVTPYVKTVKAVVSGFAALSAGAQSSYTPAGGGNGTTLTLTPPKSALLVEVSDGGGTPGINPELVTNASVDPSTGVVTFAPATNSGTRNVRVAWKTTFGNSAWSSATQITFPVVNVVDSTVPDLTPCVPRFTQNSDGSISISWTGATFGASGLGNYVIRRNSTNNASTSVVVGTVTTSTNLSWTDFIDQSRIGQTFYYFLEAVSAQGVKSVSPIAVKKASGNSYAVETVVAAVSTDSAPSDVTGLTVKGSQGGFEVRWTPVSDRDVKDYQLEFSALGTFADTVTTYVSGSTYFQTLGATAAKATADVYRWRIKARDFGGNLSANYSATATPDNTNYGSVQDAAPNNPASVTIANNTDGSITLTITQASSNVGVYYRVVRKSWSSIAGWVEGTGGTIENDIQIPAGAASSTTTFRDTGLKAGLYYNYRVYSRSKLGTESAGFVYATAPLAATDTTAPSAPTLSVTPQYGVSSVVVTPQEANGTIELWVNEGTTTWNAGTAKKIGSAVVGPTANAVSFAIGEADAATPVNKAYAARHIDSWGNVSSWSTAASAMSLNFLRADMIDATHVKAGTMTVDKMVVGALQKQSLVVNGHFGTYNTYGDNYNGWTLGGAVAFYSQLGTYTPNGSSSAIPVPRLDRAGAGLVCEQTITVLPGQTYTVVGMFYNLASSAPPAPVVALRIMAMDGTTRLSNAGSNPSAGSIIPDFYKGSGITGVETNNADTASVTEKWHLIAYKVTIPANMTQVRLQVAVEALAGSGNACVFPGFIQMYSDTLSEASIGADQVNQLKAVAYGGDVSGTYDALTVRSIQNRLVATTAPTDKQTLAWDTANSCYTPMSVATMLGYIPANKAGEAFSGAVSAPTVRANPTGDGNSGGFGFGPTNDSSSPAYGFMWRRTSAFGTHGSVTGDYAIYSRILTGGNTRGWIWRYGTTNVASISGTGAANFSAAVTATQFNGSGAGLTGTAASLTAGNATYATSAGNADTVDGIHASSFARIGDWNGYAYEASIDLNTLISIHAPRFLQPTGRTNAPTWDSGGMAYTWMSAGGDAINRGVQWFADPNNLGWRERSNNVWKKLWDSNNFNPDLKANLTSPSFNTSITTPTAYVGGLVIGYGNEIDHSSGADIYLGSRTTANVYIGQSKICLAPADGKITTSFPGSSLVPAGSTAHHGGIHFNTHAADNMVGFTSSATSTGTQGGVLIQGSGAYGTKIRFLTTDSYAIGAKLSMTLDNSGNLTLDRGGDVNAGRFIGSTLAYNSTYLKVGTYDWNPKSNNAMGSVYYAGSGNTSFTFSAATGAMDVVADGKFYQNEGQYQVLDTSGGTLSGDLAGTSMSAPSGFRVYSSAGDRTNGAPWYGLGKTADVDLSVGSSQYAVQVAGYYGMRLRSERNIIDIQRTDDIIHRAVKTSTFYSGTAVTTLSYCQSAAIQIREVGLVGNTQSSYAYAPKIGFHWSGRVAGNLVFDSSGTYRFMDGDCGGHYSVRASAFWGSIKPGGTGNVSLDEGTGKALRVSTSGYGYVDIGPQNTSWCHYTTDRPGHWFSTTVAVQGDIQRYGYNTRMHAYGVDVHAVNGAGLKLWNGSDGYSITMNDYDSSGFAGDAYHTGGADYNMVLRMDGDDAPRGGGDHLARGFMFRNNSLNGTYAHLAPFGNYTYWGGMLALRDVGNNSWYGLYFYNGVMYMKKLA